jgi:hypothetical protein
VTGYLVHNAEATLGNRALARFGFLFMADYLGIKAFAAVAEWLTGKGES